MKISLLTHEKEQRRPDNSGQLLKALDDIHCEPILWQRTQPNKALVAAIEAQQAVLLCPPEQGNKGHGQQIEDIGAVEHFIILDGTWQEAQKIYNKSPYLKQAKWHALTDIPTSKYNLRRNQKENGLCTAECAIEVLKRTNNPIAAAQLSEKFDHFLAADRSNIAY